MTVTCRRVIVKLLFCCYKAFVGKDIWENRYSQIRAFEKYLYQNEIVPPQSQLAVLGLLSIGGTIIKVEELANTLQVCFDGGKEDSFAYGFCC